jgi:hypothetical protein
MSIAAGWYADPSGPGSVRWWDGVSWTSTTAPMPQPAPRAEPVWAPPAATLAASTPGSFAAGEPRHLASTSVAVAPQPHPAPQLPHPSTATPQYPAYGAAMAPDGWDPMDLLVPRARTLGTRALVWGIVAVVLPIAFAPAVMALTFGAMGVDHSRRLRAAGLPDEVRGKSVAGLVLGGLSLLAVVGLVAVLTPRG